MEITKQQKYEQKRKAINVRFLLNTEYKQLLKQAEKAGYSTKNLSKYIKEISLKGKIVVKKADLKDVETAKEIIFQLRKTGVNLNQLTKLANTKKDDNLTTLLIKELKEIKEKVSKIEQIIRK